MTELLKKGARQKVTDNDGKTPLHWACGCGHLETVKVLINNDADIDPLYVKDIIIITLEII